MKQAIRQDVVTRFAAHKFAVLDPLEAFAATRLGIKHVLILRKRIALVLR